ncbi:MAG: hypothetical protein OEW11_05705 [Nitrospirota bacterium]|nr:hypothetical protein [Nitrospirota bacterium]
MYLWGLRVMMVVGLSLLVATGEAGAAKDNQYQNGEVGLSLSKPDDWVFMTPEDIGLAAGSDAIPDGMLIALARHPEPYPALNATVQVMHGQLPYEGVEPEEVLSDIVRSMRMSSPVYEEPEPIHPERVSGHPAAAVRFVTRSTGTGSSPRVLSRMWVVVRGVELFIIDMNGPAEGPDLSEAEFSDIFRSLRIKG